MPRLSYIQQYKALAVMEGTSAQRLQHLVRMLCHGYLADVPVASLYAKDVTHHTSLHKLFVKEGVSQREMNR